MRWITPQYSRKQVRKAGDVLRNNNASSQNKSQAYTILSNWRSAHAYPMHAMLVYLRRKSTEICKNPVVVQRLKRSPSIISKLRRMSGMSLDRMQDIGGCRSVVQNLAQVHKLTNAIKNSRIRHVLHNEKDYISKPKDSGYRCVHLIYKYDATKKSYKNLFIELQIRTQIQHAWATAVEVVDIFTKQALKASFGDKAWQQFFRLVSIEFARLEKAPISDKTERSRILKNIKLLENKLSVTEKLQAFANITKHIEEQTKKGFKYYIMILDTKEKSVTGYSFPSSEIKKATEQYLDLEKQHAKDYQVDVVLVSGDSISHLKKAYPNYFADTQMFSKYYKQVLGK